MNAKLIITITLLLTACSKEEFAGHIVSKHYTVHEIKQPIVIEPGFTGHVMSRHNYPAKQSYQMWTLHIATSKALHKIHVSKQCFGSLRISDSVKVSNHAIKLIHRPCK